MRERKYRAWDSVSKIMFPITNPLLKTPSTIIMDYIGAVDLHCREIYEGDVVLYRGTVYKVEFRNCGFQLIDKDDYICEESYINWYLCEVIGNIYQETNWQSLQRK